MVKRLAVSEQTWKCLVISRLAGALVRIQLVLPNLNQVLTVIPFGVFEQVADKLGDKFRPFESLESSEKRVAVG